MLLSFIVIVLLLLPFAFFYLLLHTIHVWKHWLDIIIRATGLKMPVLINVAL